MARTTLMVAAAALIHTSAWAGQVGAVLSGVVRDGSGQPVPGVVVAVAERTHEDTLVRVVIADEDGAYFIDRLHYGMEYAVEVSHPRFRKSRLRASANEGEAPIDVTVHPRRSWLAAALRWPLRPFGVS